MGGLSFFEQTVDDIISGKSWIELRRIMLAWISSDLADFTAIRNEHLAEFPYMFSPLITQRNREWVSVSKKLIADNTPTLFIVGCLHTVGPGSFVERLGDAGLRLNFIA